MGASDSKLVFKKGIFRLSEDRNIPADDEYWTSVCYDFRETPSYDMCTKPDIYSSGNSQNRQMTSSASLPPPMFEGPEIVL
jgi:hypothetical protein